MIVDYTYTFPFSLTITVAFTSRTIHVPLPAVVAKLQSPPFLIQLGPFCTSYTQDTKDPSRYTIYETTPLFFGLIPFKMSVLNIYKKRDDGLAIYVEAPGGLKVYGTWTAEEGGEGQSVVTDRSVISGFAPLVAYTAWIIKDPHTHMLEKMKEVLEKPHAE